jgi:hypothetical protein
MADAAVSIPSLHTRSMPLLAHLEELRNESSFQFLGCSSELSRAGHLQPAFLV